MNEENDNDSLDQEVSDIKNFAYLSKAENELFKEEKYIPQLLLQVKRKETKKNGEEWFILEDKNIILKMGEDKLSKNERAFLRTPEGMQFFLKSFKQGARSIVKLKKEIKTYVNNIQGIPSNK